MAAQAQRPAPPPLYYGPAGEAALARLYDREMSRLPLPCEQLSVDTPTFGRAHVLACGPADAPPAVLWHGTAAPGPFMLSSMVQLAERFRVYVPDIPCQAGSRSEPAVLDPAAHGHGRWCAEVVQGLGLLRPGAPPPLHVGVSLGGAVLLDLAVVRPEAVRAAALVVPGCLHRDWGRTRLPLRAALGFVLHGLLRRDWSGALLSRAMLEAMCDEPASTAPLFENIRLAFRWCRHFPELPNPFSDDQLQALAMPILLVAAEHDVFGAGRGTIARARELWPEAQCEAVLQEGGKHVGSDARWADASRRVLAFFERVVRQGTAAAVQQAQ